MSIVQRAGRRSRDTVRSSSDGRSCLGAWLLLQRPRENRRSGDTSSGRLATYWKLTELDGRPAALGAGERELHMVLSSHRARVHGFSGCNRFMGSYKLNENQQHFKPLAVANMACLEGMEQEQRFLEALGEVVRFTISGDRLALYIWKSTVEPSLQCHRAAVGGVPPSSRTGK